MEERSPIDDIMIVILPLLLQRFMQLFAHNDSDQSALIQKQILKIFHAYTQLHISFRVLPTQTMATWLDTCCAILERHLPERLDALDEEARAEHPCWKCKKWALHILIRTFERLEKRIEYLSFFFLH
jgi:hypothetical protein